MTGGDANLGAGLEQGLISPGTKLPPESPSVVDPEKDEKYEGAPLWKLLLISFPRLGVQMAWSAQWAALGPYLSTMLPNFAVQLTQFIGPISGIIVAPMAGVFSDRSTSPYGRRRPFLVGAALASAICWTLMGYTREMGEACGDYGSGKEGEETSRTYTALFTIIFYIWMDITVNVVMTPGFLIIADFAGKRQTLGASLGQGWSTIGSLLIAGYIEAFGAAHLTIHEFLGFLSVVMVITVATCCVVAKEKPLEKPEVSEPALKSVGNAFYQVYFGIKQLTGPLIIYWFMMLLTQYGHTAYNGNKGQFFGMEVYGGEAEGADACGDDCTTVQENYNHGVQVAGGRADLIYNLIGYIASWVLPFCVKKIGAKWTIAIALIPQSLLIALSFTNNPSLAVFWVVITSISQTAIFALMVPLIVHVYGDDNIGVYVGAINSANAGGQLINFAVGSAIINTSMGYKLPVLLGGILNFIGFLIAVFVFKIQMYSM